MGMVAVLVAAGCSAVYLEAFNSKSVKVVASARASFPAGATVGVWNWQQPDMTTSVENTRNAQALKRAGVSEAYVDISAYNDYDELPTSDRAGKVAAFTSALRSEVDALHTVGITVQALAGNTKWADPNYAYIPLKLFDFVRSYNASSTAAEQITGMQFDIEFYSDKDFSDNALQNTLDYLSLTKQLIAKRSQLFDPAHFLLGFTAVDWLDGRNAGFVPNVSVDGGQPKSPLEQLLVQLKGVPRTYVALLAYRNHATGADGTIDRARSDIDLAQRIGGGNVKMLIGEETTKVTPSKLSFYGMSKQDVQTSAYSIRQAFSGVGAFAGFAIDDQKGFLALP